MADERLISKAEQLRALSARELATREEERTRIAREIHDELGSSLAGLKWELGTLEKIFSGTADGRGDNSLREKVRSMIALVDSAVHTVRRIASDLRPSILDDLGLGEALEWQGEQFQSRTGIICHVERPADGVSLDEKQATAVFRIVQEALTNVLRHAQATSVDIVLEQNADEFVLTVADNGRGITQQEKSNSSSLGLLGMEERAHLVRGRVDISSGTGRGTAITLRIAT